MLSLAVQYVVLCRIECTYVHTVYTYIHVVCCVGDLKGKEVHTFVMCAHFPDVHTLHSMLHCGQLVISFSHI